MDALKTLLKREDNLYERQKEYRSGVQTIANMFKVAAAERGEPTEGLGVVSYASPETLLAVAEILSCLGTDARPAIPLIEDCAGRPYVVGASDQEKWSEYFAQSASIDDDRALPDGLGIASLPS